MKQSDADYLIKIISFYEEKKNKLMVKYQYCNKRVVDVVSLEDFLNSPLVYVIHPMQLYYLGFDSSNFLSRRPPPSGPGDSDGPPPGRFKRVFING